MNRNRIVIFLLIAVILAVGAYASYGMVHTRREEKYYAVSVIVNDGGSGRWTAFREGLEQGAQENHAYINFVSSASFQSIEEEVEIVRRELEDDADGLVVEPFTDDPDGQLLRELPEGAAVLACSGISSGKPMAVMAPSGYKMGCSLAEKMMKMEARRNKEKAGAGGKTSLGILSGNQDQFQMTECLKGVRETLKETPFEIAWIMNSKEAADTEKLEERMKEREPDILLSLEDKMTELSVGLLREAGSSSCRLYGIGRSERNIASLDEGWIRALAVPDEYFMGYECVKTLIQKLEYHVSGTELPEVPFLIVTKEDLYDEKNAIVLFPLVR